MISKRSTKIRPQALTGTYVRGAGKAAFFTQLDWVKEQCRAKLGFVPFPGTLNLEIPRSGLSFLEKMADRDTPLLVPDNPDFCSAQVIPVFIGAVNGALILPDKAVRIHQESVVEILAPVNLKERLGLAVGSSVEIIFPPQKFTDNLSVTTLLFDLDGTLIDSVNAYYLIVERALDKLNLPSVPRRTIYKAAESGKFNWDLVLPDAGDKRRQHRIKEASRLVQHIYPDIFKRFVVPIPGMEDVIRHFHSSGTRLGIVTSTPQKSLAGKIKILGSDTLNCFDIIIPADDTGRKKPFPDPLLLCARRLGVSPDNCAYVGDMGIDMDAGRAAGMTTIGVLTGFEDLAQLKEKQPDAIIPSIVWLPRLIHGRPPA